MKIGIITFQRAQNYGAQMQMYALSTVLRNHGHDVWILDYHCPNVDDRYLNVFRPIGKFLNKYYFPDFNLFFRYLNSVLHGYHQQKVKAYNKFLDDYFKLTQRFDKKEDMPINFDVLITGSDQVWSYFETKGRKEPFFLDNGSIDGKSPILMSYAASVEERYYSLLLEDKEYVHNALKRFKYVFAREQSLANFISNDIGVSCKAVIDPTLLLNKEEYLKIAIKPKEDHYLLVYRVTPNKYIDKIAKTISVELGLKIVYSRSCYIATDKSGMYGPREMLGYFCYADAIVTSSFHGTAFSIINRKDFYCVYDKPQSRISNLLSALQISSDRVLIGENAYRGFSKVSYNEEAINAFKLKSMELLEGALDYVSKLNGNSNENNL